MEIKTIQEKKNGHTYSYDVIQQLEYNTPVIITIGSTDKDRFGDELPNGLLGLTFMAHRTGSHSVQPITPFGQYFYNIYAHNLSSIISYAHEPLEYLKVEKALMPITTSSGDQKWFKGGKLHRDDDLPACIFKSGSRYWYQNGIHARTGFKPACISSNGQKTWYNNNKPADEEFMKWIRDKAPEYFV